MKFVNDKSYYCGSEYHGKTQYQSYCDFINDILKNIRSGGLDYCYYIYQIADLLRYEPNLKSKWEPDGYFLIWISNAV